MSLKEYGGVEWIHLAQDRYRCSVSLCASKFLWTVINPKLWLSLFCCTPHTFLFLRERVWIYHTSITTGPFLFVWCYFIRLSLLCFPFIIYFMDFSVSAFQFLTFSCLPTTRVRLFLFSLFFLHFHKVISVYSSLCNFRFLQLYFFTITFASSCFLRSWNTTNWL